jgi:hypothetical protein
MHPVYSMFDRMSRGIADCNKFTRILRRRAAIDVSAACDEDSLVTGDGSSPSAGTSTRPRMPPRLPSTITAPFTATVPLRLLLLHNSSRLNPLILWATVVSSKEGSRSPHVLPEFKQAMHLFGVNYLLRASGLWRHSGPYIYTNHPDE